MPVLKYNFSKFIACHLYLIGIRWLACVLTDFNTFCKILSDLPVKFCCPINAGKCEEYFALMRLPSKISMPETPAKRRYSVTSRDCPSVGVVEKVAEGSFYRVYKTEAGTILRVAKKRGSGHLEMDILSRLSPAYVNKLMRHWSEDGYMHFEMEYCPSGNLSAWLRKNKYLRPASSSKQAVQKKTQKAPANAQKNSSSSEFEDPVFETLSDPFSDGRNIANTSGIYVEESESCNVSFEPACIRHPKWRVSLMYQLSEALAHIHERNVVHMDIKPDNVLLHDGQFILCDFNIARIGEGSVDLDGDPVYMAPEILKNKCYFASDVYSLGIIYLSLCNSQRRLPSSGEEYSALRKNDFHGWRLDAIGRRMLEKDPKKRCSAKDVSEHFKQLYERQTG